MSCFNFESYINKDIRLTVYHFNRKNKTYCGKLIRVVRNQLCLELLTSRPWHSDRKYKQKWIHQPKKCRVEIMEDTLK